MNRSIWISLCLVLILSLSACQPAVQAVQSSPTDTVEFTVNDALGRTVTFQDPPQRIALAGKANLLIADPFTYFLRRSNELEC